MDIKHPAVQRVVNDAESWLIINGGQKGTVEYACSVLLACSQKPDNHEEFGKHPRAQTRYFPVWTEIEEFCDAFTEHKVSEFSAWSVPDKATALKNFKDLGGVPRYVLNAGKMENGRSRVDKAFREVDAKESLQFFSGNLNRSWSDSLVHTFVEDNGEYTNCVYDFASPHVGERLLQRLQEVQNVEKVRFLDRCFGDPKIGPLCGHVYEHLAHMLVRKGGQFKRKRVWDRGADEPRHFKLKPLDLKEFNETQELTDLKKMKVGAYCQPLRGNYESVDAIIVPGTLVQYFKYNKGNHGYRVHGLMKLDKALGLDKYSLWSCVPSQNFKETNFQNWLTTKDIPHKARTSEDKALLKKMKQYVVEVDYR